MKKCLIVFSILVFPLFLNAQDPQFSQFYAAPLYMGPSFAGANNGTRAVTNFRDQWPSIPGSFVTYAASFDHYLEDYNSGVGVLMLRDEAGGGKLSSTTIGLAYSYKIKINRDFVIRPGLFVNYFQKSIGYNRLTFADELITGSGTSVDDLPNDNVFHFDYSMSVLGFYQNYWFGATTDHMMKLHGIIKEDTDYQNIKISAYGGYKHNFRKRTRRSRDESMTFAFNFRTQTQMYQLDLGMYYSIDPIFIGLWYRGIPMLSSETYDAVTFLAGVKYSYYIIGYSYDATISSLITATGGAHEISLSYVFDPNMHVRRRSREAPIPCPVF